MTSEKHTFSREIGGLLRLHREMKEAIDIRLEEFKTRGQGSDERVFTELCFCLLTPQSKARVCDGAIKSLKTSGKLTNGTTEEVRAHLKGVRFSPKKSGYVVAARREFLRDGRWVLKERLDSFKDSFEARDWLAANILGLGYKEAGHFLRNIGRGEELAILDRHVLRNLHRYGVIDKVPYSLSKKEYVNIEARMKGFSKRVGIPLAHLDLLFWSMETGEIFK